MKEKDEITFEVVNDGSVKIASATVFKATDNILLFRIDSHTKRPLVINHHDSDDSPTHSVPEWWLIPSLNIIIDDDTEREFDESEVLTKIQFPQLSGWKFFQAIATGRYTIDVSMYK